MNASHKPLCLQLLPGITLSLVAAVLGFLKFNSASPDDPSADNPGSASETVGPRSLHAASNDRGRETHRLSASMPHVSQASSEAALPKPRDFGPQVFPAPSEAATAFQAGRAKLMQDHQQLLLRLAHATPEQQHQAVEEWNEQHADELAAQQQLAVKMGEESRPDELLVPSAPNIPGNATRELREFLTARHAVINDQVEMLNQLSEFSYIHFQKLPSQSA